MQVGENPQHPLVIFLNPAHPLHISAAGLRPTPRSVGMTSELCKRIRNENRGKCPFVMLTLTNIPHHYAAAHEDDPPRHISLGVDGTSRFE